MNLQILLFGITKDIVGRGRLNIEMGNPLTVKDLKSRLKESYPGLKEINALYLAVNNEYAGDTTHLHENDEIALLPPVSGG